MEEVKVTVTRKDGGPICPEAGEPMPFILDETAPIMMVALKDGGVTSVQGDLYTLFERAFELLRGASKLDRKYLCETYGIARQGDVGATAFSPR